MFGSYLTVAIRLFLRNKLFSIINIGGLTVGLTAAFFIILFVRAEIGYDTWIPNAERIYTIETSYAPPGRAPKQLARSPRELIPALEKNFAEIEDTTRFYAGVAPIKIQDIQFSEPAFIIEETFFDVLALPFAEGSADTALKNGAAVVITQAIAEKYFRDQTALGKTITVGEQDYPISGVLQPFSGRTHMDFEVLLFNGPGTLDSDFIDWTSARLYSYFQLRSGTNIESVASSSPEFLDNNAFFSPESWRDFKPSEVMALSFLPLPDIHLHQRGENPIKPAGSAALVYGFIGIAVLILTMAGINFINLSSANATLREKEISLRKLVGASRGQLIWRQLAEALFLVGIAFLVSLTLIESLASLAFNWIGITGFNNITLEADFLIIAAIASIVTGILAAIYPAIRLSSRTLSTAFSGGRSAPPETAHFRLGLIMIQYIVSIVLMITAGHFYLQTRYAMTADLGFTADNIVSYWGLSGAQDAETQKALTANFRRVPGVAYAGRMAQMPGRGSQNNVSLQVTDIPNQTSADLANTPLEAVTVQAVAASVDFDRTLDITMLAGRSFEAGRQADTLSEAQDGAVLNTDAPASIIINAMAAKALGFTNPPQAIGATYRMKDYLRDTVLVQVIGVADNAHFQTIHSEMVPMLFVDASVFLNTIAVKLETDYTTETIQQLDALWQNYIPGVPVLKTFLRDDLSDQYALEDRLTHVFSVFAALAIVIAFLGIFGLAAFNVERRTKEVGIRKVLGATIRDIVQLFVWQFSKPVLIASIIAWPLAGFVVQNWLQQFAYRIDLLPQIFISAGGTVLLIASLTVASHAIRIARINPVFALRHE
ncbi:ABC transporter permease [Kordiimonas aquimaris]|uniref:ABC transporter permease n=1 Tax=Kordiimonas aquimaris TaxID=707591 RepID=UPI0021CECB32|nr:ABC transporter permease [Kordiimonas aquimaris]